jgi:3-oxoacyl-(acyl-carrier-protein) synthase III
MPEPSARNRARIVSIASELPSRVRTSDEVEALVAERSPGLRFRRGIIESTTGIRTRRVAEDNVQCSDLAAAASRSALAEAGLGALDVGLLIFASAGQDLIEPATAHIVQEKLGTCCPVFDVKNACNSFLNGLQLAEALIISGAYETVLVAAGEVCSRAIKWDVRDAEEFRRYFPAYTMGDAGAAAVVARSDNGRGIFFRAFASRSEHWELATIPCGGSMHPRGEEFTYLQGDGPRLRQVFAAVGPCIFRKMLHDAGVRHHDFDRIFVHQVSVSYHRELLESIGVTADRVESTVEEYGNLASASIPVAFSRAQARGAIGPGDRVLWVGMASGISIGVLMMDL